MKPIKQYRLLMERMSHTTDFDTLVMIDALTDALDEVERLNEKYRTNEIRWMNIVTNIKAENERLSSEVKKLKHLNTERPTTYRDMDSTLPAPLFEAVS